MFGIRPVHQVVIDGAVRSSKGVLTWEFATEVEERAPGVVEENAECAAFAIVDEVRDALINGVGGLLPAECIGIPHREGLADTIKRARLVAEAEEMGVGEFLLVNMEALTMPFDRAGILLE